MARKINPTTFRLGILYPWSSRWFSRKDQAFFLEEDQLIRETVKGRIRQAGIAAIDVERTGDVIRVSIRANRPGLIIGRGGRGIEELKALLDAKIKALRASKSRVTTFTLQLNVVEFKRTEISAAVVAEQVAGDIERRQPYRRVMKRYLDLLRQNRGVKGGRIQMAGRLNGAEIARRDWLAFGRMPLQNLRADIDYGVATAFNTYGTIGVKVWIYKGEIFSEKPNERQ